MANPPSTGIPDGDAVSELLDAGAAMVAPKEYFAIDEAPDLITAVIPEGYRISELHLAGSLDLYRTTPRRQAGTVTVLDAPSFLAYWGKHKRPESEVHADVNGRRITAVLDAPAGDIPGWGEHRVALQLDTTPAWQRWASLDRRFVRQHEYAEHIEDSLAEIVTPDAATMLELVQSFEAATKVQFTSAVRLSSGERRLRYEETTGAKAGNKGDIDIPTELTVRLQPFKAGSPVDLKARFRYRISEGALLLGHVLDRPDEAKEAAFAQLVGEIATELDGTPVLMGPAR